jgi:hypothetical protein
VSCELLVSIEAEDQQQYDALAYHMRLMFYDSPVCCAVCYLLATSRQNPQVLNGACVVLKWTCEARQGLSSWMSVSFYSSDVEIELRVLDQ